MASLALPRPGLLARLATALEEGVLMMGERDGLVRVGAEIESWPVEKKKKLDLPPSSPPFLTSSRTHSGRRDPRTRAGKRFRGSNGVTRPKPARATGWWSGVEGVDGVPPVPAPPPPGGKRTPPPQ